MNFVIRGVHFVDSYETSNYNIVENQPRKMIYDLLQVS